MLIAKLEVEVSSTGFLTPVITILIRVLLATAAIFVIFTTLIVNPNVIG